MTNSSRFPEGNEKQIPAGTNILWRGIHFPNTPSGLNGYKAVNENDPFCETTSNKKLLLGCLNSSEGPPKQTCNYTGFIFNPQNECAAKPTNKCLKQCNSESSPTRKALETVAAVTWPALAGKGSLCVVTHGVWVTPALLTLVYVFRQMDVMMARWTDGGWESRKKSNMNIFCVILWVEIHAAELGWTFDLNFPQIADNQAKMWKEWKDPDQRNPSKNPTPRPGTSTHEIPICF